MYAMPKSQKTQSKVARDAATGEFVVVNPAVAPKGYKTGQIRAAVHKVLTDKKAARTK